MVLINKKAISFIANQGEKLGMSLIRKPVQVTNIEGLRYAPQRLSTDVVEASKKVIQKFDKLDPAELQMLADKNLSLSEMASELGIKVGKLRKNLEINGILSDTQKEFRMLKKYFTATTEGSKAEAFVEIDKYLEKIAREEFKLKKGTTFEDCLQDVRLRFFEIVDKSKKDGVSFPYGILKEIKNHQSIVTEDIETVGLNRAVRKHPSLRDWDAEVQRMENNDFDKNLWEYLSSHMYRRSFETLKMYIKEGKTTDEIADIYGLSRQRLTQILQKAMETAKTEAESFVSKEHLKLDQLY